MKKQKYSKEEQIRAAFIYVIGEELKLTNSFCGFCSICGMFAKKNEISYKDNFKKFLPSLYKYYGNQKHPLSNLPRMVHLFWFHTTEHKGSSLEYRLKLLKEYYNL